MAKFSFLMQGLDVAKHVHKKRPQFALVFFKTSRKFHWILWKPEKCTQTIWYMQRFCGHTWIVASLEEHCHQFLNRFSKLGNRHRCILENTAITVWFCRTAVSKWQKPIRKWEQLTMARVKIDYSMRKKTLEMRDFAFSNFPKDLLESMNF